MALNLICTISQAPEWEELENFDSDDLWSEKAFILIEKSSDPKTAHVWIGSDFDGRGGAGAEEYAKTATERFTKVRISFLVLQHETQMERFDGGTRIERGACFFSQSLRRRRVRSDGDAGICKGACLLSPSLGCLPPHCMPQHLFGTH